MNTKISVSSFDIDNTHSKKLLGVTIDRKLNFQGRISNLCKKASEIEINFLFSQNKLIMKFILIFQFCDCPLIWVNHIRTSNNRINSLHESTLRIVYKDFKSLFHQLLEKDNSITIRQHDLKTLAIELLKVHNNITPEIMKDVFEIKSY